MFSLNNDRDGGPKIDVRIVDRYDEDLAILRTEFPALGKIDVEKQILPAPAPAAPQAPQAQAAPPQK